MDEEQPQPSAGRRVAVGAVVALLVVAGVALFGTMGRGPASRARRDAGATARGEDPAQELVRTEPGGRAALARYADAGALTVRDRALRDEIRGRIWRAWSESPDGSAPTGDPLRAPLPPRPGNLDARYIRDRIRDDFIPMARACYDALLVRRPGVEGRVAMEFDIVADVNLGGVVEEARFLDDDAGVPDAGVREGEFLTCMRESMLTVAFLRPGENGRIRVRYPFTLRPGADAGRE